MLVGSLLAVFSAFLSTLRESSRKFVSGDFSSVEIGLMGQIWGSLLLLPFVIWHYSASSFSISPLILLSAVISGGVVISSTYLYIEAMRITDLSITEPLRKTTPIFVAILEPLILGIKFQGSILAGALFGSLGAYILVSESGLLKPFREVEIKGVMYSILVALIFAIWAIAVRFGATNTDPLFFLYMTYIVGLIGFGVWHWRKKSTLSYKDYLRKDIIGMSLITAFSALIGVVVYSMISASTATIIKQTSAIFGVLIGGRFFKEKGIVRKLLGSLIIIIAVAAVTINI